MNLTTFSPKKPDFGTFFCLSTSFTTAQSAYQIVAATSGKSIYLTDIVLLAGETPGTIQLTEAPAGTSINILDPVRVGANAVNDINLVIPLKITSGSSLRITTVGFNAAHGIILNGYIQ